MESCNFRIGIGFDVHRLIKGESLILGGVKIPYHRRLEGWSDGDVLIHAIIDALLGATSMGDIGEHFPPGDPQYKDISSLKLLEKVERMVSKKGYCICNLDSVLILQEPRIASYREEMQNAISKILGISQESIGIKATTPEGLGFLGRNEAIAAQSVVLIERTVNV